MNLKNTDNQIYNLIKLEEKRQKTQLAMIPSENYASKAVREAVGAVLMNKYSEGYSNKRYYQGNEFIDEIELIAIERAKKLFNVPYVNVQAYSGSPANTAVFFALLEPKDTIMGLEFASGGHLTHGHPKVTFSGKYFNSIQYTVEKNGYIDYKKVEELALKHKPKLIISGTTAYPRTLDFKKFGQIADKINAWHLADISHIAGLVAAGEHPSPVNYSHVVMSTTHKTLRGPRGAVILGTDKGLKKDPQLGDKIDRAIIPGLQGGPHNNTTAGIAVCLKEASSAKFKKYSRQVVLNSKSLANELINHNFQLISGGTDNHLILIDLTNKNIDGWCAAWALEQAGIIVNKNAVPFETRSAFYPSGIRLGTPAITTLGMKEKEMKRIAEYIDEVINETARLITKDLDSDNKDIRQQARKEFKTKVKDNKLLKELRKKVKQLCLHFPLLD